MRDGAQLWIEKGICTGAFLAAVLKNNLVDAFGAADDINAGRMRDWATWLWSDIPAAAWGSVEKMRAWTEARKQAKADALEAGVKK